MTIKAFTNISFQQENKNDLTLKMLNNIKTLQIGSGGKNLRADSQGLWLGANKFSDAPFSVDMDGNMKATSGVFSGTVSAATITGSTITGGTINGTNINGSIITGSKLRTSTGGSRIEIDNTYNNLILYEDGEKRVKLDDGYIMLYDDDGDHVGEIAGRGGNEGLLIQSYPNIPITLNAGNNVKINFDGKFVSNHGNGQAIGFLYRGLFYLGVMSDSSDAGVSEPVGSMYLNSSDDHIHIKTNSGWKKVANMDDLP